MNLLTLVILIIIIIVTILSECRLCAREDADFASLVSVPKLSPIVFSHRLYHDKHCPHLHHYPAFSSSSWWTGCADAKHLRVKNPLLLWVTLLLSNLMPLPEPSWGKFNKSAEWSNDTRIHIAIAWAISSLIWGGEGLQKFYQRLNSNERKLIILFGRKADNLFVVLSLNSKRFWHMFSTLVVLSLNI